MAQFFQYQAKAEPIVAAMVSVGMWFSPLAEPVRDQAFEVSSDVSTFAVPAPTIEWHGPLSEPVRQLKLSTAQQQSFAAVFVIAAPAATPQGWNLALAEPLRDQSYEVSSNVSTFGVPALLPDKWLYPWSEPVRQKPGLASRYQQATWLVQAAPFPETITESRWHQPWSEPSRRKLNGAGQFFGAWGVFTPTVVTVTEANWHEPWSEPSRRKISAANQPSVAYGYFTPAAVVVTPIDWAQELYQPRPEGFDVSSDTSVFSVPFNPFPDKWLEPLAEPPKPKSRISVAAQQTLAWSGFTPAVVATTDMRWQSRWPDKLYKKTLPTGDYQVSTHIPVKTLYPFGVVSQGPTFDRVTLYQSVAVPPRFAFETITEDKWHQPWSAPLRSKRGVPIQQTLAWGDTTPPAAVVTPIDWAQELYQPRPESFEVVNGTTVFGVPFALFPDKWHQPFSTPPKPKPGLLTAAQQFLADGYFTPATEVITEDKWHQPWSAPLRAKTLPTADQPTLAYAYFTPVVSTAIEWFEPFSEPTRRKPLTAVQPNFSYSYFTARTTIEWFEPWQDPVRQKLRLNTGSQQALALHTNPIVSFGWYGALVDPAKPKRGLAAYEQQWLAFVKAAPFPEDVKVSSWLEWMAEPVRQKLGLSARLQQFFVSTPRILPNAVIVTMAATEDNQDEFRGIIKVRKPPHRVIVSIQEIPVPSQNLWSIHEDDA